MLAFAFSLVNCGSDSHPLTTTNQFAFIREAVPVGATLAREVKGGPRLHQHRMVQRRAGLRPFAVDIDGGTDSIVLMNNDGTGEAVAVDQGGWFYSIQIGLNGKSVAFTADITGVDGTYQQVLVATGSGTNYSNYTVTQLTSDAEDHYQAQLSPDGAKVIFVKDTSGLNQAYVISATGGTETLVPIPDTMDVYSPTFTPDGQSIVFEDCVPDSINIVKLDGTGMTVLNNADGSYEDDTPSVSPDGKLITFLQDYNVFVMDINGQNVKQLTTDGMNDDPMFVNDKIVYLSFADEDGLSNTSEIYSMNADGTNPKRLTTVTVDDRFQYYDENY